MDRSCHTKQIAISVVWTGAERQESTRQESSGTATASWVKVLHFHVLYNKANTIRRFPLYGDGQGSGGGGDTKTKGGVHLEPLGHVGGADLVVLVGHVTALQLAGLVELKDALATLPPLGLLLGPVPALLVLVLLLLLALVVRVGVKLRKVKVAAEDLLRLLQGSVGETRGATFQPADVDSFRRFTQTHVVAQHSRVGVAGEFLAPFFGDGLPVIVHDKVINICGIQ